MKKWQIQCVSDAFCEVRQHVGTSHERRNRTPEGPHCKSKTLGSIIGIRGEELENESAQRGESDLRPACSPAQVKGKSLVLEKDLHVVEPCAIRCWTVHCLDVQSSLSAAEEKLKGSVGYARVAIQTVLDPRVPGFRCRSCGGPGSSVEVGEELVEDCLVEVVVVAEKVVFARQRAIVLDGKVVLSSSSA